MRDWLLGIKEAVAPNDEGSLFTKEMFEGARRLFPKEFEGAYSFDFFKRYIDAAAFNLYRAHPNCEQQYKNDHPGQETRIAFLKTVERENKPEKKRPKRKPQANKAATTPDGKMPAPEKKMAKAQMPAEKEVDTLSVEPKPGSEKIGVFGTKLPSRFLIPEDYTFGSKANEGLTCAAPGRGKTRDAKDRLVKALGVIGASLKGRDSAGNMSFSYGRVDFLVLPDGSVIFDDTAVRLKKQGPAAVKMQIGKFDIVAGIQVNPAVKSDGSSPPQAPSISMGLSLRYPGLEELFFKGDNQREKREILEATHDIRFEMLTEFRDEASGRPETFRTLSEELNRIWDSADLTLMEKKRRIFGLWDTCLGEEDAIGRAARARVVEFIRTNMPKGSAKAFSGEEIAKFNTLRKSAGPFEPYGMA
ncbi:MAG TPA: hypothetical protein PLZ86_01540 [bacterium]|nr:hypothetical protein [bacterium]